MLYLVLGDNWEVVCKGKKWKRDEKVKFKHVDTAKLATTFCFVTILHMLLLLQPPLWIFFTFLS